MPKEKKDFGGGLHELTHALGLTHPGGVLATAGHDTAYDHSVTTQSYNTLFGGIYPQTPMLYDIAALQFLYGKKAIAANNGNTTHYFDPTVTTMTTLWDHDGIQTLAVTSTSTIYDVTLDLNETTVSKPHYSFARDSFGSQLDGKLFLAYGSNFCHATGGNGNDTLIGNAEANKLSGGSGNDNFSDGLGNDIITGGTGGDTFKFSYQSYGVDRVKDFNISQGDKLDLSAFGIYRSNFESMSIQVGANTEIRFDTGYKIILENVSEADLINAIFGATNPSNSPVTALIGGTQGANVDGSDGYNDWHLGSYDAQGDKISNNNDIIIGNGGHDTLEGAGGNDLYIWRRGDGHDKIYDMPNATDVNTVWLQGVKRDEIFLKDATIWIRDDTATDPASTGDGEKYEYIQLGHQNYHLGGVSIRYIKLDDVTLDLTQGQIYSGTAPRAAYGMDTDDTIVFDKHANGLQTGDGSLGNDIYVITSDNHLISIADNYGTNTLLLDGIDSSRVTYREYYSNGKYDRAYDIKDENDDIVQTVTIRAYRENASHWKVQYGGGSSATSTAAISGDSGANVLAGTGSQDTLAGYSGNDVLDGGAAGDTLAGGYGVDHFKVSNIAHSTQTASDHIVDFEDGTDIIDLRGLGFNSVNNNLTTTSGQLRVEYDEAAGATVVKSDQNSFAITLDGDFRGLLTSADFMLDTVTGGGGSNPITGTAGNDSINGTASADIISGLAGNDTIFGSALADSIDGGTGTDTVSYASSTVALTVNLSLTTAQTSGGDASGDVLTSIENVIGGSGNDNLTGDGNANVLTGNNGNDTLSGGVGNDTLIGGTGADSLVGGADNDTASYASDTAGITINLALTTAQTSAGEASGDILSSIERIIGGSGNDSLSGSTVDETLEGGNGNDTLSGGAGADYLDGGAGTNTVSYASDTAGVTVNLAITTAQVSAGQASGDNLINIQNLIGGSGNDSLSGNSAANSISGGNGNDTLLGAGGNDSLTGGAGSDVFKISSTTDSTEAARDTITDYTDGATGDSIDLRGTGFTTILTVGTPTAGQLILTNDGTNTLLSDGVTGGFRLAINGVHTLPNMNFQLDTVTGGSQTGTTGNDTLTGGNTADTINGGDGNDTIYGNAGNDSILGGNGNDLIFGGADNDNVNGEYGVDTVYGGDGDDTVQGGKLNDVLYGDSGNDFIYGAQHNDTLIGGTGLDNLYGGTEADVFKFVALTDSTTAITDIIQDFEDAVDKIDLSGLGFYHITSNNFTVAGELRLVYDAVANRTTLLSDQFPSGFRFHMTGNHAALTESSFILDVPTGPTTLSGSAWNDTLNGTVASETILGLDGNDAITGNAGADTIDGGNGIDSAYYSSDIVGITVDLNLSTAQTGNSASESYGDVISNIENVVGGTGDDTIVGSSLDNNLTGADGEDLLRGEWGNDSLFGGNGDDTLSGGKGNDQLKGEYGNDILYGEQQNDNLSGGKGNDTLYGGTENDGLYGEQHNDVLYGEDGDDTLSGGSEADTLDVGNGTDTATYSNDTVGITLNLGLATAQAGNASSEAYGDILVSIENAIGGTVADSITGSTSSNSLSGLGGADTLLGGNGNDTLDGGTGADSLDGGAGTDTVSYAASSAGVTINLGLDPTVAQTSTGEASGDYLRDIENAIGSANNDSITGSLANNVLYSGDGNDYLNPDYGTDTVYGGNGNDSIYGWKGGDVLYGDDGNDVINGQQDADTIVGGAGADSLTGGTDTADVFKFLALTDSTTTVRDIITDFVHLTDKLDLADLGFTAIQAGAASGTMLGYSSSGGHTYITAAGSDFSIDLTGSITLTNDDFIFS